MTKEILEKAISLYNQIRVKSNELYSIDKYISDPSNFCIEEYIKIRDYAKKEINQLQKQLDEL